MDELIKDLTAGGQQRAQGTGGLGELLGAITGGGGLGSVLGSGTGGSLGALIPTLLPVVLGMLGSLGSSNQTGLHQLVDTMHANGLGDVAQSWVGPGPSMAITTDQVHRILTPNLLTELAAKSGLPQDQVSLAVASILPHVVNHLTPGGVLPDPGQVQSTTAQLQGALAGMISQT